MQRLISVSALTGAAVNASIAVFVNSPGPALWLRFLTGAMLAGVYPPGMKLMATWCKEDRGWGISLLIGALTIGSALPHLVRAFPLGSENPVGPAWRWYLTVPSLLAAGSAVIMSVFVKTGPFLEQGRRFHLGHVFEAFKRRPVRLANFGYLGHMWELYAMWTWVPIFLLASYQQAGMSESLARLAGFAVVAAGGIGSVMAGFLGDRWGRTVVAGASLVLSASCALVSGLFFDSPVLFTVICLIWGVFVVSDSAQFSAAVSELCDQRFVGTTLTIQTSLGFLLTLFTIRLIPWFENLVGREWTFSCLVLGPVFGIWSMSRLRRLPEAKHMASGHR
jgi:MFS family permease